MDYHFIHVEVDEERATILLNRPPDNLLNIEMMEDINRALLTLRRNNQIEVLVLRGADRVFCGGLDLEEHVRQRVQRLFQVYSRIFEAIRMMDVISIAAVDGRAWGGGFELALGCNLIVASESASFALPEVQNGLFPPIACIILPRVAPRRRAMEWILTGDEIAAAELAHFGLVNRVFAPDRFEAGLEEFVDKMASKSGPVLQLAKRAQYEAYYSTYEEALYKVQNLYLRDLIELKDATEGVRAHREGREARWQNR